MITTQEQWDKIFTFTCPSDPEDVLPPPMLEESDKKFLRSLLVDEHKRLQDQKIKLAERTTREDLGYVIDKRQMILSILARKLRRMGVV